MKRSIMCDKESFIAEEPFDIERKCTRLEKGVYVLVSW